MLLTYISAGNLFGHCLSVSAFTTFSWYCAHWLLNTPFPLFHVLAVSALSILLVFILLHNTLSFFFLTLTGNSISLPSLSPPTIPYWPILLPPSFLPLSPLSVSLTSLPSVTSLPQSLCYSNRCCTISLLHCKPELWIITEPHTAADWTSEEMGDRKAASQSQLNGCRLQHATLGASRSLTPFV